MFVVISKIISDADLGLFTAVKARLRLSPNLRFNIEPIYKPY